MAMVPPTAIRNKWGVIIPSTNIMVEHDLAMLCPPGVTFHAGRAYISRPSMASDAAAKDLLDQMEASFDVALRDVLTLAPDRIVIAMSAEVMRRGVRGGAEFVDAVAQKAGLPVTTGPAAVIAGLQRIGATRIAVLTPYQPESDQLTSQYLRDCGFDVVHVKSLRRTSATDIAKTTPGQVIAGLRTLATHRPDAIVVVGTNLGAVALAAEAEHWLGVPTIAMNAATVWHALREAGIPDRRADAGFLLRDF
ncbi:arylmalonate decarboxylase [Dactylosporangium sp. NBC_01737]|uniref:maleate cis-trans isomerase family protein n=1 Tax=Dactylosporangium sp. NBC_01737 TaxID=2975959 RepID=UPI002E109734|nr:arylmalonate decarboxylase [Dactylosporangium sp. NBC_01737]